jgi:hypothetical protein
MPTNEVRAMRFDVASIMDENQKAIAKEENLDTTQAILFPKSFKSRFVACAIALQQIADNSNMGEKLGIDEELTCEFKRVLASRNYLINSASFRRGDKYHDFDKFEIDRKLGRR